MSVFLQTNRFHTERGYQSPSAGTIFNPPTADAAQITHAGVALLESIFNPDISYKRAGVVLTDLTPATYLAPSLFDEDNVELESRMKSRKLMNIVDNLNEGPGPHTVKIASQLTMGHPGHNDGYSSSFGVPTT